MRRYDEYFSLEKFPGGNCEETQGHIIKYFTFHDDKEVLQLVTEMLSESHPITIKNFNASLTSEEHRLYKDVPKLMLQYKSRIVGLQQTALQKEIAQAGKEGDNARLKGIMEHFQKLAQVRAQLEKELKKY